VRQLFSWRFVAAVAALGALALLTAALLVNDDSLEAVIEAPTIERRIDLIEPIVSAKPSADFEIEPNGVTQGFLDIVLDADRVARIAPGTPGEVDCDQLEEVNQCALFADMLGDAVVWFAILPQAPGATVELPPIVDLQDGVAAFENGWRVRYAPVIERECGDEDIVNFADFLERFGPDSVSIVDLETGLVVAARCTDP
jgi:hypothetical protein